MKMEGASPARLLEMLADRFGAFEAIAYSTIKLARHVPEDELSMDVLVAEAVLEFGSDLREPQTDSDHIHDCNRTAISHC
jgi:hypothetical protein